MVRIIIEVSSKRVSMTSITLEAVDSGYIRHVLKWVGSRLPITLNSHRMSILKYILYYSTLLESRKPMF